jgi:two-component system aerobic respiration control sensor histidine kinase ArcB
MSALRNKQADAKNLVSEIQQLKRIIHNLPGCIYWKDKAGVYLGCNKFFLEMVGVNSVDEVVGKTDEAFCLPEQVQTLRKNDKEAMIFGPMSFEEKVKFTDDEEFTYTVVKSPLYDDKENIIGVIGTSLDITQQKEFEEDLKEAKSKAEVASKAKTEFIANMSHDVKTPLSGIISLSEVLNSRVQEEYRDITQDILEAGQHLMVFFENCIELSKLESGSVILSKEIFSLKHLLNEIFRLFKPAIKVKGLALYINYADEIPKSFLGSRATLYRILLNLIGNAVKFTQKGSITICVKLSQNSTLNQAIIKLTIADTGIGIPDDKQKIIFERFARLTPSYQGVYEGSGIGLYIVEEFVRSMGGEIHLKSQEDKGSQFTVVVPLQIPLLAENEYADELDSTSLLSLEEFNQVRVLTNKIPVPLIQDVKNTIIKNVSRIKVLLVEDNLMAQKAVNILLTSLGCQVDVVNSGKEAISVFEPGRYALVFMDIGLPDMKGYEIAGRLKEMERETSFSVPILGLSAHVAEEEKKLSMDVGMIKVLAKPLQLDEAKAILAQHVPPIKSAVSASLLAMENGLRISDLQKVPNDLAGNGQIAWAMLDELIACLTESRAEIEKAYKAQDMVLLLQKVHKLHGDVCYASTPDLLLALEALETNLRNGEYKQLDILYVDFLKAIEIFEKIYHST